MIQAIENQLFTTIVKAKYRCNIDSFLCSITKSKTAILIHLRRRPDYNNPLHFQKDNRQLKAEGLGLQYIYLGDELRLKPNENTLYTFGKVHYPVLQEAMLSQDFIELRLS